MIANSYDCQPYLPATSASLDSPPIDLSDPLLAAVVLDFDIYYDHFTGDDATVEVWDGSDWVVIWTDPNNDVNTKLSFDVSAWALGQTRVPGPLQLPERNRRSLVLGGRRADRRRLRLLHGPLALPGPVRRRRERRRCAAAGSRLPAT